MFAGDIPFEVEQFATPFIVRERILPDLGLYVQDQWTIDRMTLNMGVRVDYLPATSIPLVAEQELFLPRRNQVDLRLTKGVPLGDRLRLEGSLGIYNVFNANDVMRVNPTFGGAWIRPLRNAYAGGAILTGRLLQVSGRLSF